MLVVSSKWLLDMFSAEYWRVFPTKKYKYLIIWYITSLSNGAILNNIEYCLGGAWLVQ